MNEHEHMVRALLGDRPEHLRAYRTSGSFHHTIDQLAAWLPIWVDGMAVACQLADERQAQQAELLKRDLFGCTYDAETGEMRTAAGAVVMTVPEQYRSKVSILRPNPEHTHPFQDDGWARCTAVLDVGGGQLCDRGPSHPIHHQESPT